jgi:hypothetical protein
MLFLTFTLYGCIYYYFFNKIKNKNIINKNNIGFLPIFLYFIYSPLHSTLLYLCL